MSPHDWITSLWLHLLTPSHWCEVATSEFEGNTLKLQQFQKHSELPEADSRWVTSKFDKDGRGWSKCCFVSESFLYFSFSLAHNLARSWDFWALWCQNSSIHIFFFCQGLRKRKKTLSHKINNSHPRKMPEACGRALDMRHSIISSKGPGTNSL